jgi:hypothetical protein
MSAEILLKKAQRVTKAMRITPTLDRKTAREVLQQYVELMDLLRDVERRMARLEPKLHPSTGHDAKAFYGASEAWETCTANVRTVYEEIEALAININLQAL